MPRQIPIILVTRSEHEAAVAVMLRCCDRCQKLYFKAPMVSKRDVATTRSCGFKTRCCHDMESRNGTRLQYSSAVLRVVASFALHNPS